MERYCFRDMEVPNARFPKAAGMAEGPSDGSGGLQGNGPLPQDRDLRFGQPDEASRDVDSYERAMGSASELDYEILLATDLGFLGPDQVTHLS